MVCNNTYSAVILIITVTVFTDSVQCSSVSAELILRDQLFNIAQTYHAFLICRARLVQSRLFREPREKLQMVAYREVITHFFLSNLRQSLMGKQANRKHLSTDNIRIFPSQLYYDLFIFYITKWISH